ncbi:hypothetical protein HDU83_004402 [Entophlyctis luteolus]|nr:hypothetical protein HDU83_004402 [Entophlyctis luteolus]
MRQHPGDSDDAADLRRHKRMMAMDFADADTDPPSENDGNDDSASASAASNDVESDGAENHDGDSSGVEEEVNDSDHGDESQGEDSRVGDLSRTNHLKRQLADATFGDLLQVQESIGSKQFKKLRREMISSDHVFSTGRDDDSESEASESGDSDDSEAPEVASADNKKGVARKGIAKRSSKHAPAEMSSKRPVSRKRTVVELPKKEVLRDPRFSKLSGKFNEGLFSRSYGFLEEYEKADIEKMKKAAAKEKNPEKKAELEKELQSKISRQFQKQKDEKLKAIHRKWKKSETEAVKKGKNPFFLKKSDKEKLALLEQYKSLKPGQGVDKFLEKRRKKNSANEKRFLPNSRR